MKSLASRVAALERKQKRLVFDDGYREERFIGKDGLPWVRYHMVKDAWLPAIELACNGRDDPMQEISRRVETGEAKPAGLTHDESEIWDISLMKKLGEQIIRRIHTGEIVPEDLSPNERDCWELVTAVRERF